MQSASEEVDVLLTSCLYYVSKGDTSQCTNILEKRRIKAQQATHSIKLKQVGLELAATKQKLDGLQRRETYLCRQKSALQSKIDKYKSFFYHLINEFEDSFNQFSLINNMCHLFFFISVTTLSFSILIIIIIILV